MSELINLERLCEAHRLNPDPEYKVLFEEIFLLCVNESFIDSIISLRSEIEKGFGTKLPIESEDDFYDVRSKIYKNDKWGWYQNKLVDIRKRHGLIGQNYGYDPLSKEVFKEKSELSYLIFEGPYSKSMTKEEIKDMAKEDALFSSLKTDFSTLESILFYNDPMKYLFDREPPTTYRGGNLSLRKDLSTNEWLITGEFFINTSKEEMKEIVDKDYGAIEKMREIILRTKSKKVYPKKDLDKKYLIYKLTKEGRTKEQIANALDKRDPGKDHFFEAVDKAFDRLIRDSKRFDPKP